MSRKLPLYYPRERYQGRTVPSWEGKPTETRYHACEALQAKYNLTVEQYEKLLFGGCHYIGPSHWLEVAERAS